MTELRAPDPTLDAFRRSDEPINYVVNIERWPNNAPSIAHRVRWTGRRDAARCGADAPVQVTTQAARWFAVPCRTCFPDAPPHGVYVGDCGLTGCDGLDHEPGEYPPLAWQVGGDTP